MISQTRSPQDARIKWSADDYSNFGRVTQVLSHSYDQLPLFETASLVALLDDYPRSHLQAFTMGTDPTRRDDWHSVDIGPNTTGRDIWKAVARGRLWLNLISIETHYSEYAELVASLYRHLDQHCPHLGGPIPNFSTLLISSPGAQVYYHLDAPANMLWHLRGQKRIWIYPAMDLRFVPQQYLEDIYTYEHDEFLPYRPEFDRYAEQLLLTPGKAAAWPRNAPHRIENVDMNVSLTTSYRSPQQLRRDRVQFANRYLLRPLGIAPRPMDETGLVSEIKQFSYRAINKIRPFKRRSNPHRKYITHLRLDPEAPNGIRKLDQAIPASFRVLEEN
ncbi:MAG: hypothetical protein AAFQ61_02245 [Cyanobacteria bacterium J06626_23]